MKKYPKLRYPGEPETEGLFAAGKIIIQEKMDGSNFRFSWNIEDGFTFGSRNTYGDSLQTDQFEDTITYLKDNADTGMLSAFDKTFGELVYFGEAMNPHTISYDWANTPYFIGFDIWNVEEQMFLPTDTVERLYDELGLPLAPILDEVPASEWKDYDFEPPESAFYDGLAEGAVFKNHDTGVYGKFVRDDFKENNKKAFGKPKKHQESGAEKLAYQYVANPRIEKAAHRLVDEGEWDGLTMDMMVDLPEEVIRDMATEEAGNIFMGENWDVDLGDFRSIISGRCATILRRMIDETTREAMA